jgi:glutathione synthase/RimK-type ligase-like ATP-grasp enzyme
MPVAIKPRDGNHGKGVSLNLENDMAVAEAFALAQNYSRARDRRRHPHRDGPHRA